MMIHHIANNKPVDFEGYKSEILRSFVMENGEKNEVVQDGNEIAGYAKNGWSNWRIR